MKLTLLEISNLNHEINGLQVDGKIVMNGLLSQKTSLKVKVYLQRLSKAIADDVKLYEDERLALYKKYGEEKEGKYNILSENVQSFIKDLSELQAVEKEIEVKNLWSSDLNAESVASIETNEFYPIFLKLVDE